MKSQRQEMILKAVEQGGISTQEQLQDYLTSHGIQATQATVSRDMKELKLQKTVKRGGKAYYEVADSAGAKAQQYKAIFMNTVVSVEGAGNMVCVRCGAGMAQAVCAALDAAPPKGVLGSLAGEDTIFLLCHSETDMQAVKTKLIKYAAQEAAYDD